MLNILHYFHVIYVQAHLPNEPYKLWRTDSIVSENGIQRALFD